MHANDNGPFPGPFPIDNFDNLVLLANRLRSCPGDLVARGIVDLPPDLTDMVKRITAVEVHARINNLLNSHAEPTAER